jgi:hypothetical protein
MNVRRFRALTLGLVLASALTGCASHKELSAPCKRPDSALSYQVERQPSQNPASEQLRKLAHPSADCGPMAQINSNPDDGIVSITEAPPQ